MEKEQLLEEVFHEVTVTANGESMENVVGKLFQLMRKKVFTDIGKPVVQMEAHEVYFDQVQTHKRTEKFMLFFWPREKVSYTVTARIIVKLKYLNITKED